MRNLELKARCPDLAAARKAAFSLGVQAAGVEIQIDTFFHVPRGRLKLREIDGKEAVLIWYDRPDHDDARLSNYYLVPVPESGLMKTALQAALGIRGEVRKRREIFLWHHVRIHLDEVAGFGPAIEFEAVLSPQKDVTAAQDQLDHLCQVLRIMPEDHLKSSYADLLGI